MDIDVGHLNEVLKYLTDKKEDFYDAVSDPHEHTPHLMYADWLQENGDHKDHKLAGLIRDEVDRSQSSLAPKRPFRAANPSPEYIVRALKSTHPNPTVRAVAQQIPDGIGSSHDLLNLLFSADPHTDPLSHDLGVALSHEDGSRALHADSALINRINKNHSVRSGISAKAVRGRVYLLNELHPRARESNVPAIVYEAPLGDSDHLARLEEHANQLAGQQERQTIGRARVGPVEFTSRS